MTVFGTLMLDNNKMKLTIREDDINKNTPVNGLKYSHEQFLDAHQTHTIGLLCDGLEENVDLINYINSTSNWEICIHGWNHHNYCLMNKNQIEDELDKSILKIDDLFGVTPVKWFLPFNGWTQKHGFSKVPWVANIALYHGIDVLNNCQHIKKFLSDLNDCKLATNIVYYNGWDSSDLALLPELLFFASNLKVDNLQEKRDNKL